jgi:hypothetical protein
VFIRVKRLIVVRKNIKIMSKLKTLEELLQNHDWFYQYSDDYSVYERGQNAWKTISKVMEALDDAGLSDESNALYEKYLPKQLKY